MYNWGLGNLLKRAEKDGYVKRNVKDPGRVDDVLKPFTWSSIALRAPTETQDYVTKIEQYAKNPP